MPRSLRTYRPDDPYGRRAWTDEDLKELRRLAKAGVHSVDIAEQMGRTPRAVRQTMYRLGIKSNAKRYLDADNPREIERRKKVGHPGASNPNFKDGRSPREHQRDRITGLYSQVYEELGGQCTVCGTTENLEVDHVQGDGPEHRRQVGRGIPYVRELLRTAREEPGRLQLLCHAHHVEKTWGADT